MVQVAVKLKCLDSDSTVQEKDVSPQKGHTASPSGPLALPGEFIFYFPEFYYDRFGFFF